mmetsp:Transcript_81490/g.132096  ORF Transcript_81490/g.132096 Transcript_81490/m.132096 type:complete len:88 (-) Transcript_81490:95-358(-)
MYLRSSFMMDETKKNFHLKFYTKIFFFYKEGNCIKVFVDSCVMDDGYRLDLCRFCFLVFNRCRLVHDPQEHAEVKEQTHYFPRPTLH